MINTSSLPIQQCVKRIFETGRITVADRMSFLYAMGSQQALSVEENYQVKQVFERLQMGLLTVVEV